MNFKSEIKKIIGVQKLNYIKGSILLLKNKNYFLCNHINFNKSFISRIKIFQAKKSNLFCGYYDYNPLSKNKNKLLCQKVKINAIPSRDETEIGIIDIKSKKSNFKKICTSNAWCWQQGSRIHWSEKNENNIYYNDVDKYGYCTKLLNILNGKIENIIYPALYDIAKNEKYGISINFSRLQRLRPGYGYDKIPDNTIGKKAPENDGLIYVDIKNKSKKLLISLKDLSKDIDPEELYEHYINHVSISPNDDKVMFFHIWIDGKWPGWMARLCIFELKTKKLIILEQEKMVSHYNWLNNDELIITCTDKKTKKQYYRIYDLKAKKHKTLNYNVLHEDGHPTKIFENIIVSDTYPNNKFTQKLFLYNMKKNLVYNLLDVFSDPRLVGEFRCDLHPKVSNNIVIIDTTYNKCKRSIIYLEINYKNGKWSN